MATLANVYGRLFTRSNERAADRNQAVRVARGSVALRAFANEDIYFFVKRIDNSRVVREADPRERGACWKLLGTAGAAVVLLIGVLLPSAYGLLAGYQVQSLKQEERRLDNERASLELEEAQLLSPARMEELAKMQQFVDPPAQKVIYLDSAQAGTVAMNGAGGKK